MIDEKIFKQYENFIDSKNNGHTLDYIHDIYSNGKESEGYKIELAEELQYSLLRFFGQKRNQEHTDEDVINFVKNQIINKASNLVNSHQKISILNILSDVNNKYIADIFRKLYCTDNDKEVFEQISKFDKCNRFDLLAYLMFSKNPKKYLPIATTHIDNIFKILNIDCPTLSGNISWDNYMKYIDCVKEVQNQLIDRYPFSGISLLDAHSFLWIIESYEIYKVEPRNLYEIPDEGSSSDSSKEKGRSFQNRYRLNMLELWNSRCAVTGCSNSKLIVASHAKPYSKCFNENGLNYQEAYNKYNGFPLVKNYDALFDAGLITFNPKTAQIIISKELSAEDIKSMGINPKAKLSQIYEENLPFLNYHYYHVFVDNKKHKLK